MNPITIGFTHTDTNISADIQEADSEMSTTINAPVDFWRHFWARLGEELKLAEGESGP